MTVQLAPGLSTVPDTQVPPVIVNVPVPETLLTGGAAVSFSGPALAPVAELVIVTVPVFAVRLAGVVVKAGAGPANAAVPPVTVNGSVLLVPPGVVIPRFLISSGASREIGSWHSSRERRQEGRRSPRKLADSRRGAALWQL